jgi:predicted branched-subunit amino acid permease
VSLSPAERAVVRDSLGVGIATGLYGASFGAISVASGLSVVQTCVLSLLMFTGASQFALVGVLSGGGAAFSAAATAMLLGTRNTLYGLRVAPLLDWHGWRRAGAAQLLIDESTAMSVNREARAEARIGFLVTGGSVFVLWNLFTLLGAVGGNALGDPRTYGLDAAVGGAFLALLWPQLTTATHRVVALLAVAVALGLVPVATAGVPVLAAGGVALLAGLLARRTS